MFVVCVLVSRERAQARESDSSADANSSLNNSEGAPPSQSVYRGMLVRGSSSGQNQRQQHQYYAGAYAESSPAAYRLETGARGQNKYQGRINTPQNKASTHGQHRQTSGSPAGQSSQSPAMPQSASLNHPLSQSMYNISTGRPF